MDSGTELKKFLPFALVATLVFGLLIGLYVLFGYSQLVIQGSSNSLLINNVTHKIPADGKVKVRPGTYTITVINPEKEFTKKVTLLPFSTLNATPTKAIDYSAVINAQLRSATYIYSSTKLLDSRWLVGCGSNGEDDILAVMYYQSGFWLPISFVSSGDSQAIYTLSAVVPESVFSSVKECAK